MSHETVDETCVCGARFVWSGDSYFTKNRVKAFREDHQHATAVEPGPCWADGGATWPSGISPRCELKAGHAGAHECDRGAMGGTATWTDEEHA